jgi:3-phosphoshikimate 1-carboxyvinyltransferase
MKVTISKSVIKGKVAAPSSKSYTIRGLMCAALADGESRVINPLGSDDTEAAENVLGGIGIGIKKEGDVWLVSGGNFIAPKSELFCNESAATLRFMTAVASLVPGECRLTTAPSLSVRPIISLIDAVRQLGVECSYNEENGVVTVSGGRLAGGVTELPGNISSQFVSALLMIAPFAEEGLKIRLTTPLESQSFVLMTLECLKKFGIEIEHSDDLREFEAVPQKFRPAEYVVEGDWSSASYLLALGAIAGEIEVTGLNPESLQGDRVILDIVEKMGADVTVKEGSIAVRRSELRSIDVDLNESIDLLPTVGVLAAAARGTSELTGIERARLKESDRISAVAEGLSGMGIAVEEERNRLKITGSEARGSVIDTRSDHRIAMAFGMLGVTAGDTVIDNAECVSKTYPEYWDVLRSIGGEVKLNGK